MGRVSEMPLERDYLLSAALGGLPTFPATPSTDSLRRNLSYAREPLQGFAPRHAEASNLLAISSEIFGAPIRCTPY